MNQVAVVIPCFNLGRYLDEAVDSALQQTRSVSEIVVVDDGSTDLYTRQVLAHMRYPTVRIVRTENRGLSRTRNHGIELSTAPYVVLLDADDVLDTTYVEKMAGCLDENPDIDIVSCALQAFEGASYRWTPNGDVVGGIVKGSLHASSLFRRHVFDSIGGFDPDMPAFEASEFWIRAMERGFKVRILREALLKYRIRTDSKYHKAITGDRFVVARKALLRKHAATVDERAADVIAETDAFLVELGRHRRWMTSRKDELAAELAGLEQEHARLLIDLDSRSVKPFDWGDLHTAVPLGNPQRASLRTYYTNRLISRYRFDISGSVVSDDPLLAKWLGRNVREGVPLESSDPPPAESCDCVLLTEVFGDPGEVRARLTRVERLLRPGGVLMCVFPCFEPFAPDATAADDWRYTESAARLLLAQVFPLECFHTESVGNVKILAAALHGLDAEQIDAATLNHTDPSFPFLTWTRAVKRATRREAPAVVSRCAARGAVLMYHRIATLPTDERHLCLAPELFRRQMAHLRRYFHPMPLEDMARAVRDGTLPDRAVAVTLDDGYLDALTAASPILTELSIPATFFINTFELGVENEFWGDRLERIFFQEPVLPGQIDLEFAGRPVKMRTDTAEERHAAWRMVADLVYPLPHEQRMQLVHEVSEWSRVTLAPRQTHRRLVGTELVALARREGHSIGAHTTHHLQLTAHSAAVQRWEMADNKVHLERLLGQPVVTLAYPYGVHDDVTIDAARAVPFVSAVTVKPGLVRCGADLLTLPRLEVPLADVEIFESFLEEAFRGD